jgi:methylmalonyl-CoA mutase N-terminal domain/subunit
VQQLLTTAIAAGLTPRFGALTMTQTQTPSTPSTAHTQCSRTHRAALKAEDAARLAATVRDAPAEHTTISGLVLEREYGVNNLTRALRNVDEEIPPAGTFPFTRGVHKGMYRDRLWTMRQFAGFGSADDTNARFKYLLEQAKGTKANTGLSTAFDLPTLMGRDSDDPLSAGEVGKCGVAIDTIEDMHRLYADIPVEDVTVSQTINGPAAVIWAMYIAMAKQRGIDVEQSRRHAAERHPQGIPRSERVHLSARALREARRRHHRVPDAAPAQVELRVHLRLPHPRGRLHRDAGTRLHPARRHGVRRGVPQARLDVDAFAPRLSFFFNSHNEFFEEICKLRAARRIWAPP